MDKFVQSVSRIHKFAHSFKNCAGNTQYLVLTAKGGKGMELNGEEWMGFLSLRMCIGTSPCSKPWIHSESTSKPIYFSLLLTTLAVNSAPLVHLYLYDFAAL